MSVDDATLAAWLHPSYRDALTRLAHGGLVSRGIPFTPPGDGSAQRWMPVQEPVSIDLAGTTACWLVLLHFCDAWRDGSGRRPEGVPVGWVWPVGEPLARLEVRRSDGSVARSVLRRRFEINEGIVGWGSMAFLALPHLVEAPVDWRGPHPRQGPGSYAAAGHAGPLTVLPGTWGASQTGVADNVPSPDGDLMLWLHAVDVRGSRGEATALDALDLSPLPGDGSGRLVVLAAVTAFSGASSPLRWQPRRALRVSGAVGESITLDLGLVARRAPLRARVPACPEEGGPMGWGTQKRHGNDPGAEVIELTAAADAVIHVGDRATSLAELDGPQESSVAPRGLRIETLAPADRPVSVTILGSDGRPAPARVRTVAADGRYLPPLGHRLEVNPAIYEDSGADILLAGDEYAYVDGQLVVPVPADGARLEVVRGLEVAPALVAVDEAIVARGEITVRLAPPLIPTSGNWVSGDTHVHFLGPSTALLQARAEGVNVVHLLATQWGDHHTGLTDTGGDQRHADGRHAVWVGSENRQNMLGHVGIVGTRRPLLPFASGGPPEGAIGDPVTHLMADWLRRCRELGGLAIGAHFPLPMAEVAADIEAGLLDALEMQCFDETLQSPPIREWYRYLDMGHRLPLVGGTDKMSAEIPLGQVRTWARLSDDEALTFEAWARAVRSGRTFVTSGPILELWVDGHEPGDEVRLDPGAAVEVELRARAAQPLIDGLEIVLDGSVVAASRVEDPVTELVLRETIRPQRTGWIAGRSLSPYVIGSAFASAMAAHTSPLYVEMPARPRRQPDLDVPLALIDGSRAWLEALAPLRSEADAARFRRFLDESERRLRERGS
ncbi:hypothetical protein BH23CHL8_BH23CHL8_04340 [soil metagenome]